MRYRQPAAGKPRRSVSKLVPAPVAGLIANRNLAVSQPKSKPQGAYVLENFLPTAIGARMRGGSGKYATIGAASDSLEDVTSLFTYVNGLSQKLFAADSTGIYDITVVIDPDTPPAAAVGSLGGGNWSVAQFATAGGVFLRAVNGEDTPLVYDGSSWGTSPSITAGTTGLSDPSTFSFVWAFKSRLFFIQNNSLDAYYLGPDTIGGAVSVFPLGGVFTRGGSLMFGATWSLATNSGLVASCIFVTTEGEIAVYSGTDPGSADTWSLVGVYRIGRPLGKKAFIRAGGDIIVATDIGFIPVSQAVQRDVAALAPGAISFAIEDVWNREVADRYSQTWSCETWPTGQLTLIAMPRPSGLPARMLVANVRTGAWGVVSGWDARSVVVFGERAFIGSTDGRVIEIDVTGSDDGQPYTATYVPLFEDLGNPSSIKISQIARLTYKAPRQIEERLSMQVDYSVSLPVAPDAVVISDGDTWGTAVWGESVWGEEPEKTTHQRWTSCSGYGYALAPAVQITSGSLSAPDVDLISIEYTYIEGDIVS